MKSVYHAGELAVQARVGVQYEASRVGGSIRDFIPELAQEFLRLQPMAILGSVDAGGRVWASLMTGPPGFMEPVDDATVRIAGQPAAGDPLRENLRANPQLGMLAIELQTRRRMRLNGTASLREDGIHVSAEQVWGNCPKYIQKRTFTFASPDEQPGAEPRRTRALTVEQQRWVSTADTLFIATSHADGGADASHRGGQPGFVQVLGENRLRFGDYAGNNMFQTLGNIVANPSTGLLFLDFETGDTLQLTGQARINWDEELAEQVPGALRLVEFEVEEVIETRRASRLRWKFQEYSPFNP